MLRAALTGGIAAGKSVALERFGQLGAAIIDSDKLAREVLADGTEGLRQVARTFGPSVLERRGSLDRAALARVVFADSSARELLEKITHPLIKAEGERLEAEAVAAGARVLVRDIPLLVETGQAEAFDEVVVVEAPLQVRRHRAVMTRGMEPADFAARVAAQASDAERAAVATAVLDGSGPVERLRSQVDEVFFRWLEQLRGR